MQNKFLTNIKPRLEFVTEECFATLLPIDELEILQKELWSHVVQSFSSSTTQDPEDRFDKIARSAQSILVSTLEHHSPPIQDNNSSCGIAAISEWKVRVAKMTASSFVEAREKMLSNLDTANHLGIALCTKSWAFLCTVAWYTILLQPRGQKSTVGRS